MTERRAPSTIVPPQADRPNESRHQRRALAGPKRFAYAIHSNVRDAYAFPVQVVKAGKGQRRRKHRKDFAAVTNIGGSSPCDYAYGR